MNFINKTDTLFYYCKEQMKNEQNFITNTIISDKYSAIRR